MKQTIPVIYDLDNHDEEMVEQLYWDFDNQRKLGDERLTFKGKLRYYASEFLRNMKALTAMDIEEAHKQLVIPEVLTEWIHINSGNLYRIDSIGNLGSTDFVKFPYMVRYTRLKDSTEWDRPLIHWYKSFQLRLDS